MSEVLEHVRAGGLLAPPEPVVVMLSGGRDSVCLLDVAVALLGAERVVAVHVNYGLREAADADERLCRGLCQGMAVELDVVTAGELPGGNLQARARDFRYRAARAAAARDGRRIAVAHTASDQAETVLYRLAASPGRRALLGMAACEGDLLRPLLGVTRDQTTSHCRQRGLPWCDDETNRLPMYARARVRGPLMDALRAIHPAAEANVVRTASLLRDEAAALDAMVDEVVRGRDHVELDELAGLAPALQRLVCRRLAEAQAGTLVPEAAGRADEILGLRPGDGTSSLDIGHGVRATVTGRILCFEATPRP